MSKLGPENQKYDELAIKLYDLFDRRHFKDRHFEQIPRKIRDYWRGRAEQAAQDDTW